MKITETIIEGHGGVVDGGSEFIDSWGGLS